MFWQLHSPAANRDIFLLFSLNSSTSPSVSLSIYTYNTVSLTTAVCNNQYGRKRFYSQQITKQLKLISSCMQRHTVYCAIIWQPSQCFELKTHLPVLTGSSKVWNVASSVVLIPWRRTTDRELSWHFVVHYMNNDDKYAGRI